MNDAGLRLRPEVEETRLITLFLCLFLPDLQSRVSSRERRGPDGSPIGLLPLTAQKSTDPPPGPREF